MNLKIFSFLFHINELAFPSQSIVSKSYTKTTTHGDYNSYLSCFFDIDIGCTVDFDPDGCIDFPKRYGGLVVDV